jgi:hypothetical protein
LGFGFDLAGAPPAERGGWCGCCCAADRRGRRGEARGKRQAPTRWNEWLETAAGPASDERRVRGRLRAKRALSRSRGRDASSSPTQRFSAAMRAAERTSHGDQAARPTASWGTGGERTFFRRDAFRGEKNAANRAPHFVAAHGQTVTAGELCRSDRGGAQHRTRMPLKSRHRVTGASCEYASRRSSTARRVPPNLRHRPTSGLGILSRHQAVSTPTPAPLPARAGWACGESVAFHRSGTGDFFARRTTRRLSRRATCAAVTTLKISRCGAFCCVRWDCLMPGDLACLR